jgi:L-fuculose-phosphate aldolase
LKYNLITLADNLVQVGKRMYDRGYVASNDGNISARIDDETVIITPTGVSKGFMTSDMMVVVNMDGKVVGGCSKPSSEVFMHLQVYKDRPDVNSVCHSHPPYATGFACAGIPLDQCVLPEVIIALGQIPLVEYGTPGTAEFYEPVVPLLEDYDAFLLANHGALTVGHDVLNAYHKMETLEHFAHIAYVANQVGHLNILDKKQVKKLTDMRGKYGIRTNVGRLSSETA